MRLNHCEASARSISLCVAFSNLPGMPTGSGTTPSRPGPIRRAPRLSPITASARYAGVRLPASSCAKSVSTPQRPQLRARHGERLRVGAEEARRQRIRLAERVSAAPPRHGYRLGPSGSPALAPLSPRPASFVFTAGHRPCGAGFQMVRAPARCSLASREGVETLPRIVTERGPRELRPLMGRKAASH